LKYTSIQLLFAFAWCPGSKTSYLNRLK
jgi:hypothetical protein